MKYTSLLITGAAGFIGFHLCKYILDKFEDIRIFGIDNLNDYYSPKLKDRRLDILKNHNNFTFKKLDFSNWEETYNEFKEIEIDAIIHLGAQAGVRYSIENPWVYIKSNDLGTLNVFELARKKDVQKIVYASSSSVYGGKTEYPYKEDMCIDSPISLYAATKISNELLASVYSHLYGINAIGLRFFTVYGEFGRPDMAFWKFAKNILSEAPIEVYNYGKMVRDFTYISDIVDGIISALNKNYKNEIFNLGNDNPVELEYAISLIERYLGKHAEKKYLPIQPGDIPKTWADLEKSKKMLGYNPKVSIEDGLKRFTKWFKDNWYWIKNI